MARIIAPLVFVVAVASMANAANVDWKMYGTATAEDQETVCFYDASSVVRMASASATNALIDLASFPPPFSRSVVAACPSRSRHGAWPYRC